MKTKIAISVFVVIASMITLLGTGNVPWVLFGCEGQAFADEVTVHEGIKRIEAFDKALKSGDLQKIQETARLLRENFYAVELIKNRPHLKLKLDKIPLSTPKPSTQGSIVKNPTSSQTVYSKTYTQPKLGADALEARPSDAPKGINEISYQEMFGDGEVHTGSQTTKKNSGLISSGSAKDSTGSHPDQSTKAPITNADPKSSKKPIAHQSVKKIQPELVSHKQSTASESAASSGNVQAKSQALPGGSSGRPGTNADPRMANKSIEYKNVNRIQPESIAPGSSAIPKHVADAKPKDIPMSTKTWHDLYQNIDERVKRHYSERKTMTEAETTKLYEQMNKRNIPRETYAPYAKGKKPSVDVKSNWSDINRAANYNAQTDLKKSAKFSQNPKLSTLVDPDNAYIHPDSVQSKNLQDLRINQSEALDNLKNEFRARTKGMNPGSTQYKEQLKVYSQKKKAIETTFKSHDKRGEHFTKLQKKYPNIKATGSPPKNVRADVDIATDSLDDALKIKQEWQADGDDVLTYRDKKGRPYKIVNRTKDATMWPPETPEGRLAKISDLDAFTTTGGQKATGNINQPSSHKGFNLDNQKKLTHALDAKDWKTAAKSIDKAGRDVGLHKKNPEFYEKLGKLRDYGDGAQAGIYDGNDLPHVQQQKMQDFFKNQGTIEMAKASKRAQELDLFKKKARTDLARQMRQAGRHDIADRITNRMNQVDISNQQAEEFLQTGKTKTGNKVLTKGKSTVQIKDGIVSKIKGSIAETRELNRLAKSAQNLPDFEKGRIIQEARAKYGDKFAKKLTKKMAPKIKGPSVGQLVLQGGITGAAVASKLSEKGSKHLREGTDYSVSEVVADAVVSGVRTIPQVAAAEKVGTATYNITYRKTRQFLVDWQKKEQNVRIAKLKLERAREAGDQKKISKILMKLSERWRSTEQTQLWTCRAIMTRINFSLEAFKESLRLHPIWPVKLGR